MTPLTFLNQKDKNERNSEMKRKKILYLSQKGLV